MYNNKNTGQIVLVFYQKAFLVAILAKYSSSQILVVLGTILDDKQNNKHNLHFTTEFLVTMTRVHDYGQDKTGNKTRKLLIIFLLTCSNILLALPDFR